MTCEPEITEKEIGLEDEYLVLASDGLWDVLRNEGEHVRFATIITLQICLGDDV